MCALLDGSQPSGLLQISVPRSDGTCDVALAAATDASVPRGMQEFVASAGTWAVFEGCMVGSASETCVSELYHRIYTQWLPESGYVPVDTLSFECYQEVQADGGVSFEVWLPIRKLS